MNKKLEIYKNINYVMKYIERYQLLKSTSKLSYRPLQKSKEIEKNE